MAHSHHVRHTCTVAAPAIVVYGLLADAPGWSRLFPSVVHAEPDPAEGGEDVLRLWTAADGGVDDVRVRLTPDPDALTLGFRYDDPRSPAAARSGTWRIRPAGGGCEVVFDQAYAAAGDDPERLAWLRAAAEAAAESGLESLKQGAERAGRIGDVLLTFADELEIAAGPAAVHDFLWRAGGWAERVPHVARAALTEVSPRAQLLELDTVLPDGSTHTTESVRVRPGPGRIVSKRLRLPALLAAHLTEWSLTETAGGVRAVHRHTAVLRPEAVPDFLGAGATLAEARAHVRKALGTTSRETLRCARAAVTGAKEGLSAGR
ncbi:SRPBCC family protein [Streptomyces sp. CMB-StM0423]|uniref:SRPBCC family protein n=1 Tax=Streptomyces sp. CMB-StM0423 TaxID=2059884 RepID=UPI00131C6458|nr:SRPBCC family protein [Streptomyces sp. CMB-StM0423]